MVLDFKAIKEMMGAFLQRFDHALCMNTQDPHFEQFRSIYGERIIPFEQQDPTSEAMAYTVFRFAAEALAKADGAGKKFDFKKQNYLSIKKGTKL